MWHVSVFRMYLRILCTYLFFDFVFTTVFVRHLSDDQPTRGGRGSPSGSTRYGVFVATYIKSILKNKKKPPTTATRIKFDLFDVDRD